jgi:hypothetical protein
MVIEGEWPSLFYLQHLEHSMRSANRSVNSLLSYFSEGAAIAFISEIACRPEAVMSAGSKSQ